tara:strand:+ start:43 stop:267 length:225 start_codon:yes stop_codon:yes gene_type:complete
MKTKRREAKLISYTLLYDKSGKLITERISTDVDKLKPYFTDEEFYTLKTTVRKATTELDKIHNKIEADLNCRIQ